MIKTDTAELITIAKPFRKNWGMFFTPSWVVDFMVSLIDESKLNGKQNIKILEPACGLCQFLSGIQRNKKHLFDTASKTGVEISREITTYACANGLNNTINIVNTDFLLWKCSTRQLTS